jgi:hypothetical protein
MCIEGSSEEKRGMDPGTQQYRLYLTFSFLIEYSLQKILQIWVYVCCFPYWTADVQNLWFWFSGQYSYIVLITVFCFLTPTFRYWMSISYKYFVLFCTLKEKTLSEMAGFLILTLMRSCFIQFYDFTALAVKCQFLIIKEYH